MPCSQIAWLIEAGRRKHEAIIRKEFTKGEEKEDRTISMVREDGLRILQYNIKNLQTYITFHVILLYSFLNKVGVSTKVSFNSSLRQSVVISS